MPTAPERKRPSRTRAWCGMGLLALCAIGSALHAEDIWRIDNLEQIGGHRVTQLGEPKVILEQGGKFLRFDGAHDGILVSSHPLASTPAFTIEVLFAPAESGGEAQRFFHLQDEGGRRALLELRVDGKGGWWLDAFLKTSPEATNKGLVLIDPARVHPTGAWYWVAMRYDGRKLTSFVNGEQEKEGETSFVPFTAGKVSLGVRQNLVSWFKGSIREVRFHREAIAVEKLQRR